MRYLVYGAGALGSLIGGRLAVAGAEVLLIGRPDHVEAINLAGLEIRGEDGARVVREIGAVASLSSIDVLPGDRILLAVKTAEVPKSLHDLRDIYPETTPVFCLQNGVRSEEYAARRFLSVFGVSAGLCVNMPGAGIISLNFRNDIAIGGYPLGCESPGRELAADLDRAGFRVSLSNSIMAVKWAKLVLNLNNATLAILGLHLQLAMLLPDVARFMAEVEEEALRTLAAAGISIDDRDSSSDSSGLYDLPGHIAALRAVVEDPAAIAIAATLPDDRRAHTSTWTDLRQERGTTEAGYFNGEIVLLGEKHSVPTPYNSTLLYTIERMADQRTPPGSLSLASLRDLVAERQQEAG